MPSNQPIANFSAPPPPLLGWRRVRVAAIAAALVSLGLAPNWQTSYTVLVTRIFFIAFALLVVFGLLERWPKRLPPWIARWALQVIGVGLVVPFVVAMGYTITTIGLDPPWWRDSERLEGFGAITMIGVLLAPWVAFSALIRQITGAAQRQALAFDLERSEFERNALDARLRVLQSQVEPHFLFNTLANVQQLVDARSPQASAVLESLIGYLRAAVPRLNERTTTLAEELTLVRAYLEVMRMRMPDRLQYSLTIDDASKSLLCPPMAVLTLVENAVRHGIDPTEAGGRIDVSVAAQGARCTVIVSDTGGGFNQKRAGLGTGLATLRERCQLLFGDSVRFELTEIEPHGVRAMLEFPARSSFA
jgi:hypothetical protein